MQTILITGGAGFIGSCFTRQAIARQDLRVVVLDKLTYAGNLDALEPIAANPQFVFFRGGIEERLLVERILRNYRPTAIVNFAAESHVDRSIVEPAEFVMTNVVGTFQLLEETRSYWKDLHPKLQSAFRFLHISTDEVFGSVNTPDSFMETSRYAPNSPYAASKASSDHFVRAYFQTYGLPTITSNCSNNYGPYQFPEKLIPVMILNCLARKPLTLYGDGQQVRDWIHVEDHCQALWKILAAGMPGETYNVGGSSELTNLSVVQQICDLVEDLVPGLQHSRSLIEHVIDRPGHDRRYAVDATKIQQHLDWHPRHDFATGLRTTVEWYLNHPTWIARIADGSYRQNPRVQPAKLPQ